MATQTTLDFNAADLAATESTRPLSKLEKWELFHAENPHVYRLISDRALDMKRRGFKRWSVEEIWNWLRWHKQCPTTGKPYALPNDFKKPYVDKLVADYPQLESMFKRSKKREGS